MTQNCNYTAKGGANAGQISLDCPADLMDQSTVYLQKALPIIGVAILALVGLLVLIYIAKRLRIVVGTNDVHIVQRRKSTISYGKGHPETGNVYYRWPSWMPIIGVQTTILPVSVYSLRLDNYAAYDKGRVPFMIDIVGFFRVSDSNMAAERIASFEDMKSQLTGILQGSIRSILANSEIEEILEGRAHFGEMFTQAVDDQLKNWGITSVKTIELMDIRDAADSHVIANIMMKKKSLIESQSRIEVAANMQAAQSKEIEANRTVEINRQEALEKVGMRTAEKDKQIGVANQQAQQTVKEQEAITAERAMAIVQVNSVRQAEITKQVQVVQAEQGKAVAVVAAEGQKAQVTLDAEGALAAAKLSAEGVLAQGQSKAEAERLLLMAPVSAQVTLAKEIGENPGYQTYLVSIRQIEANEVVGVQQAKALSEADVKVIANTGTPPEGIKTVMDLFTSKGGTQIGGALEALSNTDVGKSVIAAVTRSTTNGAAKQ
jgi:flotillin